MVDFPGSRLEHRTRFAFGADVTADPGTWTWTDVTAQVPAQQITITRGRSAEAGAVTPGSLSLMLDNPSGDFTPDLATGAHYPNIVQGVPVQESLRGPTTFLDLPGTGARISTPTSADLQFTGDFDLRVDVTLTQWRIAGRQIALMAKAGAGTAQSWELGITGDGQLYVLWRESSTSTVELWPDKLVVVPPSGRLAVRAAVDVDDGAGGLVAYFWTAPTLAGPWTSLGDPVPLAGASALFPCTAPVEAGDLTHPMLAGDTAPVGRLHGLEVREGIGGTVRAAVTATAVTEGATSFVQGGRTWTVTAPAEATRWVPRITASAVDWAPTWPYGDLSNPASGYVGESRVAVSASGILQRMGQGKSPLQSTLRRRIPTDPTILVYWPMEDGAAATQAASGLPAGRPASFTGVTWASDSTLPGSDALPATGTAAALTATVPLPTGSPNGWHLEFVYRLDSGPAAQAQLINLRIAGGLYRDIQISLLGSDFTVTVTDATGTPVSSGTVAAPNAIGTWNRLILYARQTSTTMVIHFGVITIGGTAYGVDSVPVTGAIGSVTQVYCAYGASMQGLRLGHLAVFATQETTVYNGADSGFTGELAADRLIRLCSEENVPLLVVGDTARTTPMGPQPLQALPALLQECADTDGGILGEQRDRLGLRYRTRSSFYNQTPALTLDAGASGITNPFAPVLNDQALRNFITAQRTGGSFAVASDPASIARSGLYDSQVDVNTAGDDQLPGIASWEVHKGTAPGMRYARLAVDLGTAPQLADAWLAVDSGDLAGVVNLPPQHPADTVSALIQGYTETYSPTAWTATTNCTPGTPWTVAVLDDPVRARLQSGGSTLGAGVDATATVLQFITAPGYRRWIDSAAFPAMFPFTARIAGEDVTVTAITGTASPQTATVVRSANGVKKTQAAGTAVRVATPMTLAL